MLSTVWPRRQARDPAITALLGLYRLFCPYLVALVVNSKRKQWFRVIDPAWKARIDAVFVGGKKKEKRKWEWMDDSTSWIGEEGKREDDLEGCTRAWSSSLPLSPSLFLFISLSVYFCFLPRFCFIKYCGCPPPPFTKQINKQKVQRGHHQADETGNEAHLNPAEVVVSYEVALARDLCHIPFPRTLTAQSARKAKAISGSIPSFRHTQAKTREKKRELERELERNNEGDTLVRECAPQARSCPVFFFFFFFFFSRAAVVVCRACRQHRQATASLTAGCRLQQQVSAASGLGMAEFCGPRAADPLASRSPSRWWSNMKEEEEEKKKNEEEKETWRKKAR
jgi:hypothetical protein